MRRTETLRRCGRFTGLLLLMLCGSGRSAAAAPLEPLHSLAQKEKAPFLATLKDLVAIESGSGDREGLDRISALIAERLRALGGKVELIEPGADLYRMFDTPPKPGRMVQARFEGTGTKKILLIAHMDTVYLKGMLAQQPFRVEGNRAYGLGIADDKQGVALILHTLALLKATGFRDYGLVTVFIDGDEEVSAPGSRALFTKLGSAHDATFSCERSSEDNRLSLTTAGIGAVTLKIRGKASHAGAAPEQGRNALYELAHQILQTRDLSNPATGLKMNWTVASAGTNRNVIPDVATAAADVRVLSVAEFEGIEQKVRERIKNQLIPDTKVEMNFERRRPPLQATPRSEALAKHAQKVYGEIGQQLAISTVAEGGGTDAAFAALDTKNPVIERFGVIGFGAHSNGAESIDTDSIVPRLYLLTRMVMDVARGEEAASSPASPAIAAASRPAASAVLEPRSGSTVSGTARFVAAPGGLGVHLEVEGATPGQHGVHIHEKGDCSDPKAASAGGHFNPGAGPHHGGPQTAARHGGDLGNLEVDARGKGTLDVVAPGLSVDGAQDGAAGRSLVVHEKADDLQTDPAGNSGARVACGRILASPVGR